MKFIIGKKIEMTQLWKGETVMGVTKVQAGPCFVTQVRTEAKDGYEAVQVGFGARKEKNTAKPQIGHLKKIKAKGVENNFAFLREFGIENKAALEIGDKIDLSTFAVGELVNTTGVSKGKGFQGVVKRHGFSGGRKSHGNKDQLRMPGSTGATGAGHVFKGTRKPGRMGGDTITTKNMEIAEIDLENNIIYILGSVPGARNGLVTIEAKGNLKVSKPVSAVKEEKVPETVAAPAVEAEPSSAKATEDKAEKKE